jgi:hypothetical protein
MRKGLRSGGEGVSFFFFQDIMTCLIGIVLFIALLLTLFANDSSSQSSSGPKGIAATPEQKKTLSELIETIVKLNKEVKTAILSSGSEEQIAQRSVTARAELNDLHAQLSKYAGSRAPTGGNSSVKQSIDTIRQRSALRQGEVDGLAREEEEKKKVLGELAAKVTVLQENLLQEAKDADHIWLDPTVSNTTKKPLLMQVNSEGFELKELARGSSGAKSGTQLEELLKGYQPSENFVVVYFRPSTWAKYNSVTKRIRDLGFEIGTDALSESQKLDFQIPES